MTYLVLLGQGELCHRPAIWKHEDGIVSEPIGTSLLVSDRSFAGATCGSQYDSILCHRHDALEPCRSLVFGGRCQTGKQQLDVALVAWWFARESGRMHSGISI